MTPRSSAYYRYSPCPFSRMFYANICVHGGYRMSVKNLCKTFLYDLDKVEVQLYSDSKIITLLQTLTEL